MADMNINDRARDALPRLLQINESNDAQTLTLTGSTSSTATATTSTQTSCTSTISNTTITA
jgi:hypothetical protein